MAGRPSSYDPKYAEQAYKLCLLGATDDELADFFNVSQRTINTWKKKQSEFLQSLKRGKDQADATIAESLFHRAKGYSHKAVKIMQHEGKAFTKQYTEHYPPDTTAAIFWLKNRKPTKWRDKRDLEHSGMPENPEPPTINVYNSAPPLAASEDEIDDI